MPKPVVLLIILVFLIIGYFIYQKENKNPNQTSTGYGGANVQEKLALETVHPLSIEALKKGDFQGSGLNLERQLDPGSNYTQSIVSYQSEGLKIYALLTVPTGQKPENGWPAIIFNHGYIPPKEYQTTERYTAYVNGFASNGYVVLKPDYRGHGSSQGQALGGYGSNGYTIDVLNALSSLKKHPDVDKNNLGMWGHSMGGFITLRNMVVTKDIQAGVIWAGVVASYPDLINNWRRGSFTPPPNISQNARRWRQELIQKYGTPEQNPKFWNLLSANSYLKELSGPIQLHHGSADTSVPVEFSQTLEKQIKEVEKEVEYFEYPGDDHNLSFNFNLAMQRSIEFFDKNLKD